MTNRQFDKTLDALIVKAQRDIATGIGEVVANAVKTERQRVVEIIRQVQDTNIWHSEGAEFCKLGYNALCDAIISEIEADDD